ncbi:MAG: PQQ-like beta-propeller repeat protein, partial [Lentisphaerae bacterium]|nr:PQQ-like beta-propeller repeat protein [Lentisphaerota bacterium]
MTHTFYRFVPALGVAAIVGISWAADASDWPMWRCTPSRSGCTAEELPTDLNLHWRRQLPIAMPAWPDEPRLLFDDVPQPVVMGTTLFYGCTREDALIALDVGTGAALWRFDTEGPVRFAPVAMGGKVWFTSDDGHLYCLNASDGSLRWKFRGGPADRRQLGNGRLISMWPARGGPVVAGEHVYFAAGIWPFMGVFIYEIDKDT